MKRGTGNVWLRHGGTAVHSTRVLFAEGRTVHAPLTIAVASLVSLSDLGFLWRRSMSRRDSNSPLRVRKKSNARWGGVGLPAPVAAAQADGRLGHPHLDSSSLSISRYFLFWAFPGAASISFFIWAMRIFWKSSCVRTRLVLTAAALALRSSMGMLSSFTALERHRRMTDYQRSDSSAIWRLTRHLGDRQRRSLGAMWTHNGLLLLVRRVVHVNPLAVLVLLTEAGALPSICVKDNQLSGCPSTQGRQPDETREQG